MENIESPIYKQIQYAIEILRKGGVVAFPTDTVYGIGANLYLRQAVERIYRVKMRPRSQPIPLLLADKSDLAKVVKNLPEAVLPLLEHFFPGGLTLILKKQPTVPDIVTAGLDTVGVRIPDHPVPRALIRGLGVPIGATSANISRKTSPITAEEVHFQLGDSVDFIIDGGKCPGGIPSTILNLTGEKPRILREGIVTREEIEKVLKK